MRKSLRVKKEQIKSKPSTYYIYFTKGSGYGKSRLKSFLVIKVGEVVAVIFYNILLHYKNSIHYHMCHLLKWCI